MISNFIQKAQKLHNMRRLRTTQIVIHTHPNQDLQNGHENQTTAFSVKMTSVMSRKLAPYRPSQTTLGFDVTALQIPPPSPAC
jgi:hypothetical protein